MKQLLDCGLYGIIDLGYVKPDAAVSMTRALMEGGVDILQLRAKNTKPVEVERLARLMHPITRNAGVPLVINDHPQVAAVVGSEGVHVGQDDLSVAETRRVVGSSCFVGKSTHSLAQATAALKEGVDYIGFGPLFATGTKPDYVPVGLSEIAKVERRAVVPVFCIGGINRERLPQVLTAGARRVVIVSALLMANDVRSYVRDILATLRKQDETR